MGEVWLAHHRSLDADVALKLITRVPQLSELETPSTAAARFRFEARVAARLSRKTRHIVRVTDHGEEEGLAYLVMELLEGHTLEAWLMRRGPMSAPGAIALVTQIARGLAVAHAEGVVHRDLKPGNIFLARDEDGGLLVKLLDFGIARTIHTHQVASSFATAQGLVFGTPGYMSPEQVGEPGKVDPGCDLWALATIAYEALSGELPIAGASTDELVANACAMRIVPIHARNAELPVALGSFFERAFAPRLEERFASGPELALAFENAALAGIGLSVTTPMSPPAPLPGHTLAMEVRPRALRTHSWSRWRRLDAAAVAIVLVLFLGVPVVARRHAPSGLLSTSASASTAASVAVIVEEPPSAPPFATLVEPALSVTTSSPTSTNGAGSTPQRHPAPKATDIEIRSRKSEPAPTTNVPSPANSHRHIDKSEVL